jgi:1-deoxy-D-xylulose-5-phosphate synthase
MRFAKPIDKTLVKNIAKTHKIIITIEEGSIGGFSSQINDFLNRENLPNQVKNLFFPDIFIDQMPPEDMYKKAGLDATKLCALLTSL